MKPILVYLPTRQKFYARRAMRSHALRWLFIIVLLMGILPHFDLSAQSALPECNIQPTGKNSGRVLVLLLGYTSESSQWEESWKKILEEVKSEYSGYIYFSYDPNHAEEYFKDDTYYHISDPVVLLHNLLKNCKDKYLYRSYDLVGHSLGGVIAFEYIKKYGLGHDTSGLVKHVVPLHSPIHGIGNVKAFVRALLDPNPLDWTFALSDLQEMWNTRRADLQKENTRVINNLLAQSPEYRVYIAALANSNDPAVPNESAQILLNERNGSTVTYFYDLSWNHDGILKGSGDEEVTARKKLHQLLNLSTAPEPQSAPKPPTIELPNDLIEIEPLTGSYIANPNQAVPKTWLIRNKGAVPWGLGYHLVFINGDRMNALNEVTVPTIQPGQTAEISVDLTAPADAGTYQGSWQLRNPQGTFFGDTVRVKVTVPGSNNPPPQSGPAIELKCLDCPTTVVPGQKIRPTIQAIVNTGNLQGDALRGDMLRHKSGELFGAYEFVAVPGSTIISTGGHHDFTFYENDPITAPNAPGTYESVWQVWRNGGWDGEEYVLKFEVKEGGGSNRAPNAPSSTHPSDWDVYVGNETITLRAKDNGDPDGDDITHYFFEIYDSAENHNSGWITSDTWSPPQLGYNLYKWRVKVKDARDAESPWSEQERRFTVQTNEPQIYNFSYDYCDTWGGNPDRICFCVDTNAETVKLQVNSAADGSDSGDWYTFYELGTSDINCEQRQAQWGQLSYETGDHLVRLYARIGSGWVNAAYVDRVIHLPAERRPSGVREIHPLKNTYLNTRQIHFDWDPSLRTTEYRLEIALNGDGSGQLVNTVLAASTTEYAYTFSEAYPDLYWRIKAIGPYGESDNGWQLFHIDQTPPTTNMTSLPEAIAETKFTVQWSGADSQSGLNWYHVQVRDGNRTGSEWKDWLVNTTKQAEIFDGLSGHTYYFRVRAMDIIGNWEAWPESDGDTFTHVDPSIALDTPWWDTGYAQRRNLTILNNDSQAIPSHFPVALRFDATTTPTAAEIYQASLAPTKGDDVRIVRDNQVELDRVIYTFTPELIELWFPVQTPIEGAQADSTSYQLYYRNASPGTPPTTINNIFAPEADGNTVLLTHFQDGTGDSVTDSSGLGHNGNFINGGWGDGYLGRAGIFNGVDTQVDFGNHSDFDLLGPFTIETWIYLVPFDGVSSYRQVRIVDKNRYALRVESDRSQHFFAHDVRVGSGGCERFEPYRWYHFAGTFDGVNRGRIYINGLQCSEWTSTDAKIQASSFALKMGIESSAPDTAKFYGYIQHVRISNIERTSFPYGWIDKPPSVVAGLPTEQPGSGQADLAILQMQAYPDDTGSLIVAAVVQNQGDANTLNGFYTDLYVDHLPTGSGDYTGSLQFWVNSPIEPGAIVTLTTQFTGLVATESNIVEMSGVATGEESSKVASSDQVSLAAATAAVVEQNTTLYAQVDTAGLVREQDKANNISAGVAVCTTTQDGLEPDNAVAQAKQLAIGQGYNHNLHVTEDADWGKFSATAGVTYAIRTDTLGATADTYLYLYDTNGTTLLASNDDTAVSLSSEIVWKAPTDGIYYATVKHWNSQAGGCGTTYRLLISTVDTEVVTPDAPQLNTPGDGEIVPSKTFALTWVEQLFANSYQLQLASNADCTDPIVDTEVSTTSFTIDELANGTYYWRVRSRASDGTTSQWSTTRFIVVFVDPGTTKLDAPQLDTPGDAQTVTDNTPVLSWVAVAGADSYQLQLAYNSELASPLLDIELRSTSYTTAKLYTDTYYWRVRGRDGAGNWGDWSSVRTFSVPGIGQIEPLKRYMPNVIR